MASEGLRLGVAGATGALGGEVLAVLDESPLRIADLVLLATDRSLGTEVEFQGNGYPVHAEVPSLRGLDLHLSPAEAAAVVAELDTDDSGDVDVNELNGRNFIDVVFAAAPSGFAYDPASMGFPVCS